MENTPVVFVVTAGNATPVALFFTTTVAPGTTPPSLSVTTPVSGAVAVPVCASAVLASATRTSSTCDSLDRLCFMTVTHPSSRHVDDEYRETKRAGPGGWQQGTSRAGRRGECFRPFDT